MKEKLRKSRKILSFGMLNILSTHQNVLFLILTIPLLKHHLISKINFHNKKLAII